MTTQIATGTVSHATKTTCMKFIHCLILEQLFMSIKSSGCLVHRHVTVSGLKQSFLPRAQLIHIPSLLAKTMLPNQLWILVTVTSSHVLPHSFSSFLCIFINWLQWQPQLSFACQSSTSDRFPVLWQWSLGAFLCRNWRVLKTQLLKFPRSHSHWSYKHIERWWMQQSGSWARQALEKLRGTLRQRRPGLRQRWSPQPSVRQRRSLQDQVPQLHHQQSGVERLRRIMSLHCIITSQGFITLQADRRLDSNLTDWRRFGIRLFDWRHVNWSMPRRVFWRNLKMWLWEYSRLWLDLLAIQPMAPCCQQPRVHHNNKEYLRNCYWGNDQFNWGHMSCHEKNSWWTGSSVVTDWLISRVGHEKNRGYESKWSWWWNDTDQHCGCYLWQPRCHLSLEISKASCILSLQPMTQPTTSPLRLAVTSVEFLLQHYIVS